jgi:hypothetical protein
MLNPEEEYFLQFEQDERSAFSARQSGDNWEAERNYHLSIVAFCDEFDLNLTLPSVSWGHDDQGFQFADFIQKINYYRKRFELRKIRQELNGITSFVALSSDFRIQIHDLIAKIRKIIHSADIDEKKRSAILSRLNNLGKEVDLSKTSVDALAATFIDITKAIGEGAKNLTPALRPLEKIAELFGHSRDNTLPQLPPPEMKLLEGPPSTTEPTQSTVQI